MADAAVVVTDSGPVRGFATVDYRLFQGIPYAASTAGEFRWRPPQPVRPRTRVKYAIRPGPMCPQQSSSYAEVASLTEDCPCLNVIIPGRRPAAAGNGVDPRLRRQMVSVSPAHSRVYGFGVKSDEVASQISILV